MLWYLLFSQALYSYVVNQEGRIRLDEMPMLGICLDGGPFK
jgi:hypothetical protein